MGKLIQFPVARVRRVRRPAAGAFAAFGELESVERHQLKLFALCVAAASVALGALQLAIG